MYRHLISLRINPKTILMTIVIALVSILLASLLALIPVPWIPVIPLAAGALLVLSLIVVFRGATVWGWRRIKEDGSAPPTPAKITDYNGVGVAWDGSKKSVWVEVTPREAFQITTIGRDGRISARDIDVRRLARKLRQRDIVVDSIRLVTHGYRSAININHPAASAVSDATGATPMHIGGRTFAVVSVSMFKSLAAIRARSRSGGIDAVVLEAASRVRVELEAQKFTARMLSERALRAVGQDQLTQLSPAMEKVNKGYLGDADTIKVFSTVSQGSSWSAAAQDAARQIPAYRTLESFIIEANGSSRPMVGMSMAYVSKSDRITSVIKGVGLRQASGQQMSNVARAIPTLVADPFQYPAHPITGDIPRLYAGGLGMFVGSSVDAGRVFLRVAGGMDHTMWLVGSYTMVQHMLLRMVPLAVSVDIRVLGPETVIWEEFVARVNSPLITVNRGGRADVVVCPAADSQVHEGRGQTVVAYASENLSFTPDVSIVEVGSTLVCTMGHEQVTVAWSRGSEELQFLTALTEPPVHAGNAGRHSIG